MSTLTGTLPDGRRGQALAVGLVVAAAGLAWVLLVAPLVDWYGARADHLAQQRIVLAHVAQLAAGLPALRREAGSAAGDAPPLAALLEGQSDAIAGAALQSMVQDIATSVGATLTSAEALPGEQQGDFRRIGLRVTLTGSWPVLIAMLQAVETSQVRLLMDDLQFHLTASTQLGQGRPAGSAPIEASFVVLGYRPGHAALLPPVAPADLRADAGAQNR